MEKITLLSQNINEAIDFIKHPKYDSVITKLVTDIKNHNCTIMYGKRWEFKSSHTQSKGSQFTIWIKKKSKRDGKDFIWDLFHEFGHSLDTPLYITQEELDKDIPLRNRREKNAWYYADQKYKEYIKLEYNELRNGESDYGIYKAECLNTYGITINEYTVLSDTYDINKILNTEYGNQYDNIVEQMVNKIFYNKRGCHITLKPLNNFSLFNDHKKDIYSFELGTNYEDKRILIWDLFHEHGHQIDVPLTPKDLVYDKKLGVNVRTPECERRRELFAWNEADKEFKIHPELQTKENIESYNNYKSKKLLSYTLSITDLEAEYPIISEE